MKRGYRFERELLHRLWEMGFAAVRTPASGAMSYPCPDIVAGNGKTYLAIEVKMRSNFPLYISEDEVARLEDFSKRFGAKPLIAFKVKKLGWKFFTLDMLKRCKAGYKIDEDLYYLGMDFDELRGLKQVRFDN